MKKLAIIATIITIVLMIAIGYAMPATAEGVGDRGEFYPRLTVVVETEQIGDTDLWIITCLDRFGNTWDFFADEGEWTRGDLCNLLMWNMGEREEDDEVIEVYWEGHIEEQEVLQWIDAVQK